ncbi:MAG: hypothetical protein ABUL72_04155, partial [Armatimonadota bacterium]
KFSTLKDVIGEISRIAVQNKGDEFFKVWYIDRVPVAFEAMIESGWVKASLDPTQPIMPKNSTTKTMRWHKDSREELQILQDKEG